MFGKSTDVYNHRNRTFHSTEYTEMFLGCLFASVYFCVLYVTLFSKYYSNISHKSFTNESENGFIFFLKIW